MKTALKTKLSLLGAVAPIRGGGFLFFCRILFVGCLLLSALSAQATTYYVSPSGNDVNSGASLTLAKQTIQAAINVAASGDTVLVADGTYAPITINQGITVRSVNGAQTTIINGGGVSRCVYLYNANAVLDGFTITRGYASYSGGGIYAYGGTIENCIISDNSAYSSYSSSGGDRSMLHYSYGYTGAGGGISANNSTLRNCTIKRNTSPQGGGIFTHGSTIENCTISDNSAYFYYYYYTYYYGYGYAYSGSGYSGSGGGVSASGSTLRNCTITRNISGGGGGISAYGSTIENCTICDNSALSYYSYSYFGYSSSGYSGSGGGIYAYQSTLENCMINRNTSSCGGGAWTRSSTSRNCTINENTSTSGGGIYTIGRTLENRTSDTVENCTINGNTSLYGGGICTYGSTVENCTIQGNAAGQDGGGIYASSLYGGGLYGDTYNGTVENCTIQGNAAGQDGGGMYADYSLVKDCNISGNTAERDGGGVSSFEGSTMKNCTISENIAYLNGGGVYVQAGPVETHFQAGIVENCMISKNISYGSAPTFGGYDCGGGVFVLWNGVVRNCTITENIALWDGGGAFLWGGTLENCTISRNDALSFGGGVTIINGTVKNCLISGNRANDLGGGVEAEGGLLENCTVVRNTVLSASGQSGLGGGLYLQGGTVRNCIAYYNEGEDAMGPNISGISYSCLGTQIAGAGNITDAPQFISTGAGYGPNFVPGNYRLHPASPCINAGINQTWMTSALDLDGFSRILNSVVDMGAYELYNDPGILQFSPSSYSVNEDAGTVTLTVIRTRGNFGPTSVELTTTDGTALAGSDYAAQSGTLSWADGDTSSKTITIAITDDILAENDETFTVMLMNTLGAGLGSPNAATVKIADNEPPAGLLQFAVTSVDVDESGGFVILTVTRTDGSYGPASVEYLTSTGTATAGLDYETVQGTLSWADGDTSSKMISVPITDDILDENNETFTVTLRNAQSASLGPASVATVTIIDNDALADLEVSGFKFVPVNLWAGDHPAEIEFKLINEGPEDLVTDNTQLEISFYLSVNQTLGDADDIAIGTKIEVLALAAGSQTTIRYPGRAHNTDVTIPEGLSGDYYVFVNVRLASSASLYDPDGASTMRNGPIHVRIHPTDGGKDGHPWRSVVNDYDGDGQTDLTSYDETSGEWMIQFSASGDSTRFIFGGPDYETVFGDYDGDGMADPAVHQRNGPAWQIMLSGLGYEPVSFDFGAKSETRGVAADYNNDFMADPGLYDEKTGRWYVLLQDQRGSVEIASGVFGGPGYLPVVGNYDGDGKADPAVYAEATGEWLVMLSGQGYGVVSAIFGGPGYAPVIGDYDGDGKADPMLSTGSEWVGLMSGSGYALKRFSDLVGTPVAGDFDGDGTADPAVISVLGNWSFLSSLSAYIRQGPYALRP